MMLYEFDKIRIVSDYEIRVIKTHANGDKDLLIDINNKPLNVKIPCNNHIVSRLQLCSIKYILVRYSGSEATEYITVHFLKNVDFQSTILNFEVKIINYFISILEKEGYVDFLILDKF